VAGHFDIDSSQRGLAEFGAQHAEKRRLGDDAKGIEFIAPAGPVESAGQFAGEALRLATVGIGRRFGIALTVTV